MKKRLNAILVACVLCVPVLAAAAPACDEAGVREAEHQWSEAFMTGNVAALDSLLDAAYVSTNASGKPRAKAEIVRLADTYAKAHPGQHAQPMPASSTVRVIGDAAVVQHHSGTEHSVDVFYCSGGSWHAWYSQHTKVQD